MFFNFVFICSFGCFDGSPEIVTGLFPIISVSGFKGRCPRWQGWSNIAVNPRFLVGVDTDCFGRNYIIYTLPDETRDRIWIRLYVVIRRCPEHVPVHVIKQSCSIASDWSDQQWTVLRAGASRFSSCLISRQEQNGRVIRFAERWAGEGLVCVPEGGVTMVSWKLLKSSRTHITLVTVFSFFLLFLFFLQALQEHDGKNRET